MSRLGKIATLQTGLLEFQHFEVALGRAAVGAAPAFGDIFPACARRDAVFRITLRLVVDVAANEADPSFRVAQLSRLRGAALEAPLNRAERLEFLPAPQVARTMRTPQLLRINRRRSAGSRRHRLAEQIAANLREAAGAAARESARMISPDERPAP